MNKICYQINIEQAVALSPKGELELSAKLASILVELRIKEQINKKLEEAKIAHLVVVRVY